MHPPWTTGMGSTLSRFSTVRASPLQNHQGHLNKMARGRMLAHAHPELLGSAGAAIRTIGTSRQFAFGSPKAATGYASASAEEGGQGALTAALGTASFLSSPGDSLYLPSQLQLEDREQRCKYTFTRQTFYLLLLIVIHLYYFLQSRRSARSSRRPRRCAGRRAPWSADPASSSASCGER